MQVATYRHAEGSVALVLSLATFPDGTSYPARIALDAKAKQIVVTVENPGYRR
jgi:hypothetical protein